MTVNVGPKMAPLEIIVLAKATFLTAAPRMTLRQGNAVDSYRDPGSKFEDESRAPEDRYLEEFHWGIPHLDSVSWKFYLPHLISYSIRHLGDGSSLVVSGFLQSLRPPDREPPRLATVTKEEEKVIVTVLELLGFDKSSAHQEEALRVLQEYWIPGATNRI